jgi:hypothetical protein
LGVLSKSDVNAVKTMLSTTMDTYRPAYGRGDVEVQRAFLCVGSTNSESYLIDPTGNRRFWPIKVGDGTMHLDREWLFKNREQLWAEAMAAHRAGYEFWALTPEQEARAQSEQASRVVEDGFEEPIRGILNTAFATSVVQRPEVVTYKGEDFYLLTNTRIFDLLNVPFERRQGHSRRLPRLVQNVGEGRWARNQTVHKGGVRRGYLLNKMWADAQPRIDVDSPKY